ncbi:hypothetical protein RHECNPAF_770026 [Rhizobium etli CNPAF512]|nr:hypothetical protein RHECNPAF_770026 [Rhizobium etli CNPAF512]
MRFSSIALSAHCISRLTVALPESFHSRRISLAMLLALSGSRSRFSWLKSWSRRCFGELSALLCSTMTSFSAAMAGSGEVERTRKSGKAAGIKAKKRMADILARQRRRSNKLDVITTATLRISAGAICAAQQSGCAQSALAGLVARVQLVDDVDAALAANQTVVTVASLERLERILDLHFSDPRSLWGNSHSPVSLTIKSAPSGRAL